MCLPIADRYQLNLDKKPSKMQHFRHKMPNLPYKEEKTN